MSDDSLTFDVVIVGAGPAGLAAAIHLKTIAPATSVCILEKGADVGAHIISGCVFNPRVLNELLPQWQQGDHPVTLRVKRERFYFYTKSQTWRLPVPPDLHNKKNFLLPLGRLCRWLADKAQGLGVEIYPGFAGAESLFDETGKVIGVQTGDQGRDEKGNPTGSYQPAVKIYAKHTLLAEGSRGSLTESLIAHFNLRKHPQSYSLGFKEIWEVDALAYTPGTVTHGIGWPLDFHTYGGGFVYHFDKQQVGVGFAVGLDYKNPFLSPFDEFQRFKTHPKIASLLRGGRRLAYGARTLTEGGWQSLPQLTFPGGAIIGCAAGFLNVSEMKGVHTAIKSGMLAAEGTQQALQGHQDDYEKRVASSWLSKNLYRVRNIRPGFHFGLIPGLTNAAIETYITRGHTPWTLSHHEDHLQWDVKAPPLSYPKPDGKITFDRTSSVFLCNTFHREPQPCHLVVKDQKRAIDETHTIYHSPEERYCPAGVYELHERSLQINATNCIHCKTCDIKDPLRNILWTVPEGGSGPRYVDM